jgi:hypothetical protein
MLLFARLPCKKKKAKKLCKFYNDECYYYSYGTIMQNVYEKGSLGNGYFDNLDNNFSKTSNKNKN